MSSFSRLPPRDLVGCCQPAWLFSHLQALLCGRQVRALWGSTQSRSWTLRKGGCCIRWTWRPTAVLSRLWAASLLKYLWIISFGMFPTAQDISFCCFSYSWSIWGLLAWPSCEVMLPARRHRVRPLPWRQHSRPQHGLCHCSWRRVGQDGKEALSSPVSWSITHTA